MLNRLAFTVIAFVAPFAVYWIYARLARSRTDAGRSSWPLTLLFLAGALLAAQTFVLSALTEKSSPPAYYNKVEK